MQYERLVRHVDGIPGADSRRSTVVTYPHFEPDKRETFVVQTVATPEEGWFIFLDIIDQDVQAHRLALPDKVVRAIYNQARAILKKRRSLRALHAAQTRKDKGVIPFQKKDAELLEELGAKDLTDA